VIALDYCRMAAKAALGKQAEEVVVLELPPGSGLADGFTIATGRNQRQVVAIVDAIEEKLRLEGVKPRHLEGYPRREWILMDYGPFVIRIFTPKSREFYDLERLWGGARREEIRD
jgi:ribosome-associated protein